MKTYLNICKVTKVSVDTYLCNHTDDSVLEGDLAMKPPSGVGPASGQPIR